MQIHKLDEAIAVWEDILTHPDFKTHKSRWAVLNDSAIAFFERYEARRNIKDLEQALSHWQILKKEVPSSSNDFAGVLVGLGAAFCSYYQHTGKNEFLDKAIKVYQEVNLSEAVVPMFYFNFGFALRTRYLRDGNLTDLYNAIEAYQKSIEITRKNPSDILSLFKTLNNLGNVQRDIYTLTLDLKVLENAIASFEEAVDLGRKHFPYESAMCLTNLGTVFRHHYVHTLHSTDIQKAISAFKEAVRLTAPDSHNLHALLNNLGMGYLTQFEITQEDRTNLEKAIDAFRQAIDLIPTDLYSGDQANYYVNLGNALIARYSIYRQVITLDPVILERDDLKEARNAFKTASQKGLLVATSQTLRGAIIWMQFDFLAKNWTEVEQAYNFVYKASRKLFKIQLIREDKELWLKDIQGLAAHAAYALAKMNKLTKAVVTLERGLAQLLSEALERKRPDSYTPEFTDIVTAVKDSVLVYLTATKAGGLALIVNENGKVTPVWLSEVTEETLQQTLDNYLRAYKDLLTHPKEDTYHQQWLNTLETTTKLLWKQVLAPLIQALPKSAQITLIPVGRLGLLPLHAAWTEDNNMPTGKRYALDELTISYAPNARSLTEARKVAQRVKADHMLVVNDPQPVKAPSLSNLEDEVRTVVATFAQHQIFKHEAATRQAILDDLTNWTVLHFACHGIAKLDKPLESALIMANNEPLTVKDFLDLRLNGVRL